MTPYDVVRNVCQALCLGFIGICRFRTHGGFSADELDFLHTVAVALSGMVIQPMPAE